MATQAVDFYEDKNMSSMKHPDGVWKLKKSIYMYCHAEKSFGITSMFPSCRIDNNAIHGATSAMKYDLQID